jgi:hypothetical protein
MSSLPPPPPPPSSYDPGPSGPVEHTDAAGFFKALFDFSFTTFITPKVVKFVYILATVLLVATWLIWSLLLLARSPGLGVVALLLGAVAVILYLALVRMTLEFYLAIVRMSEDIHHRLPGR